MLGWYFIQKMPKSCYLTIDLIEKFENKWEWSGLSHRSNMMSIEWSIELIDKYKDKWNWKEFAEKAVINEKVFQPLLNDEFIYEVMTEISGVS